MRPRLPSLCFPRCLITHEVGRLRPGSGRAAGNPLADQLDVLLGEWRSTGGHANPFRCMTLDLLNQIACIGVTGFHALDSWHFGTLHADKRSVAIARVETQAMWSKEPGMTADAVGREDRVLNTLEVDLTAPRGRQDEQGHRKTGDGKTFSRRAHTGLISVLDGIEAKAYAHVPVTASGSSLILVPESGQAERVRDANSRSQTALRWAHRQIMNTGATCYVADLYVLQDFYPV